MSNPNLKKRYESDELESITDLYLKHFPNSDRSQKSQIRNKWRTGCYSESMVAYYIAIMYEDRIDLQEQHQKNLLELEEKHNLEYDKLDEIEKEQNERADTYDKRFDKLCRDEERAEKWNSREKQRKEDDKRTREIIRLMTVKMKESINSFEYGSWIDNNMSKSERSYWGF